MVLDINLSIYLDVLLLGTIILHTFLFLYAEDASFIFRILLINTLMLHLAYSSLAVVEVVESNYKRANVSRVTITCLRLSIIISQSFTISFFLWYLKDVLDNSKSWSKNFINAESLFSCKRQYLSCKRSILLCNCAQLAWWIDVIDVPSVVIKIYL